MEASSQMLRVNVSPHIHSKSSTAVIMRDVCIALMPVLIYSCWLYGIDALLVTAVSVVSCVFFEYISRKIMKRKQTVQDWSAVVTGILLACCLPANLPLYMVAVGAFISIVVAKQFFGGIGMNFVNPALIGRIALSVSFAKEVAEVPSLSGNALKLASYFGGSVDTVASASPMHILKSYITNNDLSGLSSSGLADWKAALLGLHTGSIGEVSIVCILIGFIYLLWRKVISPLIPLIYIFTTCVLLFLFSGGNVNYTLVATLSGGLFLGAVFMATDYTTSPATRKGKVIFALGCGILTAVIRFYGSMPEAVGYSIILMNILVPFINSKTKPLHFGAVKQSKIIGKKVS